MKNSTLVFLAFFNLSLLVLINNEINAQTPNWLWAKSMGGTGNDYGYSIALDASGNVYTTGSFFGSVDFDPGIGTFNLTSAGSSDIFICKLNSSGNFVWVKSMGGTSGDWGRSIFIDISGNVLSTGYFNGTSYLMHLKIECYPSCTTS
jgi:hypothetical protein